VSMRWIWAACIAVSVVGSAGAWRAHADEAVTLRKTWRGDVDYFATGANLAADQGGTPGTVDTLIQPQTVRVRAPQDVPVGAILEAGFVYWAGSRNGTDCTSQPDRDVTLTVPGAAPAAVTADVCHCAAGAAWSDQQVCRFEFTDLLRAAGGRVDGNYTFSDFAARVQDSATDNASFSIVLIFRHGTIGDVRHVLLYDGIWELYQDHPLPSHQTLYLNLTGFEADSPPGGKLTYFVIEGDEGGGGTERVQAEGRPGVSPPMTLSDPDNPASNPFNRTINTVSPALTQMIGVDIDQFDITPSLSAGDTTLLVTYDASLDKTWLIYNVIGVDVYEPIFEVRSTKTWALTADLNGDGIPSPGDILRFTITLTNTGNEDGTTTLTDAFGPEVASWSLISHSAGVDASSARALTITDIPVAIGQSREAVLSVTLADVPDLTVWANAALYSAPPQGGAAGAITAAPITIRRDGDRDGHFDADDTCPDVPNPTQTDTDGDGFGDLCDPCPLDAPDDSDGDGTCDSDDLCPDQDDRLDADGDGVPNGCDACPTGASDADTDGDGTPDACDLCFGFDDRLDADGDGTPDACDPCPDAPTTASSPDSDGDDTPDVCDACPGADDRLDADGDGTPDTCDREQCTDGVDNDGDLLADCLDPDCAVSQHCAAPDTSSLADVPDDAPPSSSGTPEDCGCASLTRPSERLPLRPLGWFLLAGCVVAGCGLRLRRQRR
jgi:hypothetical protein